MSTTELSGAFLEIVKVTDPDGTASVVTLGFTTDDVEVSVSEDEASAEGHSDRRRKRRRTYNEVELTVSSFVEPTLETLDEAGIIDSANSGALQFDTESRTWDACLIRVYEDEEDASPALIHRFDEVEWSMPDGLTYPSDFATAGLTGWVHGSVQLDATDITGA
jgi:hypothetical protein